MQLSTIITEIRDQLGEDEPDFWSDEFIVRAVNEAQRRFAHEDRWSWLYTQATGSLPAATATLALQPDVAINRQFSVMLSRDGLSERVLPVRVSPATGFRLRSSRSSQQGQPGWYYLSSTVQAEGDTAYTVTFVPVPNLEWDVEYMYVRNPADLENEEDEPDIPEAYVEAIITWATAKCWLKEMNGSGKAQEQFNLYNAVLLQAKQDEKSSELGTIVSWGGEEPQLRIRDADEWTRARIPPNL